MSKVVDVLLKGCGQIDPISVKDYESIGGYQGLRKAVTMDPQKIVDDVTDSKLMGRGGAAFSCGRKWGHMLHASNGPKYVVCNGDEGEPGTFKDQVLMGQKPLGVIEGMTIAGYTFGSPDGYIYIRGEYREIQKTFEAAIEAAKEANLLGKDILGTGWDYDIHVISGAGAYVCGENSALLNSIEGKPGRPRIKPPHLADVGLFGKSTLVNNVETLSYIPTIIREGVDGYKKYGTEASPGTKLICLSGDVVNKGVYEVPFGLTMREIIEDLGGGVPNDKALKLVHIGGQSGPIFGPDDLDTKLCYKDLADHGLSIGSGAIVVVDESRCVVDYLKNVAEFFTHESCGKCTPCREGTYTVELILDKFMQGAADEEDLRLLKDISLTMAISSFCGLGQTATAALDAALAIFPEEIEAHMDGLCPTGTCPMQALEEASAQA